jgi:hypothetical protein
MSAITLDLVTQKPRFHIFEWSGTNASNVGWETSLQLNWRPITRLAFQLVGTGTNPTGVSVVQLKAFWNATQFVNCAHYRWPETGIDIGRNSMVLSDLIATYQVADATSGSFWWCNFMKGTDPVDFVTMAGAGFRCDHLTLAASAATSAAFTWTTVRLFVTYGEH